MHTILQIDRRLTYLHPSMGWDHPVYYFTMRDHYRSWVTDPWYHRDDSSRHTGLVLVSYRIY